jgi:hypothetical protein
MLSPHVFTAFTSAVYYKWSTKYRGLNCNSHMYPTVHSVPHVEFSVSLPRVRCMNTATAAEQVHISLKIGFRWSIHILWCRVKFLASKQLTLWFSECSEIQLPIQTAPISTHVLTNKTNKTLWRWICKRRLQSDRPALQAKYCTPLRVDVVAWSV